MENIKFTKLYKNNNLSTVVLTQNILCIIIPIKKTIIKVIQKLNLKIYDINKANNIVNKTSTMAILNIL